MKFLIVVLSLVAVASCLPTSTDGGCDFSLTAVKALYDSEEEFRTKKAFDPTDNSKKLTKFSTYTAYTGDNAIQIKIDDDFISEDYKVEGGNFVTQKGQIQTKTEIVNFEKTADGFKFKQFVDNHEEEYDIPVKTFDAELPSSVKVDDKHKTIFNKIVVLHKKLYAVKEKMEKDSPSINLYDFNPNTSTNGYYLQFNEANVGLSQQSDGSSITGRYTCGQKDQEYSVIKGDVQLVGEPKFPIYH